MGLPEKVWVESCSKLGSVWSSAAPTACLTRRRRSSNGVDGADDRQPAEDLLLPWSAGSSGGSANRWDAHSYCLGRLDLLGISKSPAGSA